MTMKEINKLKEELKKYKILNQRLTRENEKLKRERKEFLQRESRNIRHELNNVKKKNKELQKKVDILTNEINVLTKEMRETNCRQPGQQVIDRKLTEMKELEKLQISSTNETFYKRLVTNLKNIFVDPFFHHEQATIYDERKNFFIETYGLIDNCLEKGTVILWHDGYNVDDGDYDGDFYAVPYQIVQNFDEVVTKSFGASCHQKCEHFQRVFFERNEEISYDAYRLFDRQFGFCEIFEGDISISNFQNFANMIAQRCEFIKHPKTLEQIALKAVLRSGIPLHELPKGLQMKAQHGYLTKESPIPENLTDAGRYWYEALLTRCKIENLHFKYSVERREECVYSDNYDDEGCPFGFI